MNKLTKEEAIKILKDTLYDEKTPTDYLEAVKMGREALENQKTGHWIDKGSLSCRCSVCGCKSGKETRFCPYCGAKMEGE